MPKHKNCPNCAAPYDMAKNRCPYCGTVYFDMSTIDFDSQEPFYLKIKNGGYYITQLVKPVSGGMSLSRDITCAYGRYGERLLSFQNSSNLDTELHFTAIQDGKQLMIVEKIEDEVE